MKNACLEFMEEKRLIGNRIRHRSGLKEINHEKYISLFSPIANALMHLSSYLIPK